MSADFAPPSDERVAADVARALQEDIGGGDATAAVVLNVLAVVPLLATDRFPALGAAAASLFSFVVLVSPDTAVTLSALTPRLCSLYYQSSGEGELVVTPPGMSCGTGCMDYPAGAMVTATFNPNGKSIGTQVSLNATAVCDGVSPCAFRRTRCTASTAVIARLDPSRPHQLRLDGRLGVAMIPSRPPSGR